MAFLCDLVQWFQNPTTEYNIYLQYEDTIMPIRRHKDCIYGKWKYKVYKRLKAIQEMEIKQNKLYIKGNKMCQ